LKSLDDGPRRYAPAAVDEQGDGGRGSAHSGRLELTWTNKDKRLLSYEDGSYVWVTPSDHRVAEVRLLDDAGTVGAVNAERRRAHDNLLIHGDALNALTSLAELPEFASQYVGKVKLAYLDPPFNTQQSFLHYDDALEHSVWLTMMRDRLVQVKKLLAPEGSVWVHLDDAEMAYCRAMMDEVFGRANFVATVVWQKVHAPKNSARHLSSDHDYLLIYARDGERWRPNPLARTEYSNREFWNPDNDPRGPWRRSDLTASKPYSEGLYAVSGPAGQEFAPRQGRYWSVSRATFERLGDEGRLWWGKTGTSFPFRKRFLDEVRDLVPTTFWVHTDAGNNREAKGELTKLFGRDTMFSTPKPERLLHRIVHVGSNPGDIVLDPYLGSGTTAAVAHKMGRRWVGVERSRGNVDAFAAPRLTKVVQGEDPGGVTEAAGWTGGGAFRRLDVSPSMFDAAEGSVVIADWAANGKLSEVTAAQLGFAFEPDAPFVGRRGRSRLAVIDGLVNADVAQVLVDALPEDEVLTLCGTAVDEATGPALRALRRGSTVRKIPASILADYRRPRGAVSDNGSRPAG
jgi:adenine-specific DNA-methyltransferase